MKLRPLQPRQPLIALALSAAGAISAADWFPLKVVPSVIVWSATMIVLIWRPRMATCCACVGATFFALHSISHHGSPAMSLARELRVGPEVMRVRGIVTTEPEA